MSEKSLGFKGYIQDSKSMKQGSKNIRVVIELYENDSTPSIGGLIKAHEISETPFQVLLTPIELELKPEPLISDEYSAEWAEEIKGYARDFGQTIEFVRELWRKRIVEKCKVDHFRMLDPTQKESMIAEIQEARKKIIPES